MQPIALNSTTSHFSNVSENVGLTLLVTGCSGFIGSHLVNRLLTNEGNKNYSIRCMTRNVKSIENYFDQKGKNIKYVAADASKYSDLVRAMTGVDTAFYLIHSMEGSSKDWKKFAERDRRAAENFAKAASECNVKRIIYLGGLVPDENGRQRQEELSEHMKSRIEVGEILNTSSAKVTIFRAAIILGQGGGSFQMLQYLVERLPLMICPKWVLTKSQPIALDDVINYLIKSIESRKTEGRSFDLG
ncbi:MAG: NAD(P)H-binding protein, partial [Nitrososphaeraceae archaeon]